MFRVAGTNNDVHSSLQMCVINDDCERVFKVQAYGPYSEHFSFFGTNVGAQ
jgi:hypothetical protein